ncbi:NAD(P)-dependent oxidoreductase [Arthrobacter gandavensis]|uniref:NAD-dependent epimerase/dehydratase family protein n=1 Tax=Arthrobacter gandavensis TaxID=169960 RepID=UPI00188F5420|nr:NAD(P)-dependent oxidoreductase [Arthrobacter gandavensis]MBF4993301.1 NAD(P)-dependent oxidoreductase [Arthrobacter gandavensis]
MTAAQVSRRRIAVTGAAGSLARDIIPRLVSAGYTVSCVDRVAPEDGFGQEWTLTEVAETEVLVESFRGCDAVIHLAGIPLEDDWDRLLAANIDGTHSVLEAARQAGVPKAVLASSIHAAGFTAVPAHGELIPDTTPVRPNTLYGVSKAALEALGSYYADRHGMDVLCLRIASRFDQPRDVRMLSTWLSPDDAARLCIAALADPGHGFRILWGVSANTRSYLSPDGGAAIGYFPQDNAENYAQEFTEPDTPEAASETEWDRSYIGGVFCSPNPPRHLAPQTSR